MAYSEEDFMKLASAMSRVLRTKLAVLDRSCLPYEEKYRQGACCKFSDEERDARAQRIRELVQYQTGYSLVGDVSFDACAEVFFHKANHGVQEKVVAILVGNSPHLSDQEYWANFVGLPLTYSQKKSIEDISRLHELVHFTFAASAAKSSDDLYCYRRPEDTKLSDEFVQLINDTHSRLSKPASKIDALYQKEAIADAVAIKYYRAHNGYKEGIEDFVRARHLAALFSHTPSNYWTAMACEAAMRNEPVPSYTMATTVVCALQTLLWAELKGLPLSPAEAVFMRVGLEASIGKKDENGNVFSAEDMDAQGGLLRGDPLPDVIQALSRVIENPQLDQEAFKEIKLEGKRLLRACQHFCYNDFEEARYRDWKSQPVVREAARHGL